MGFFKLSDGNTATSTGEYEDKILPIPDGTKCIATIDEAVRKEAWDGSECIKIRFRIAKPSEYQKRVVYKTLYCWSEDTTKSNKAISFLTAVDTNCGGKLQKEDAEPNTQSLSQALIGKPMYIEVGVYTITDKVTGKVTTGNTVNKVSPYKKPAAQAQAQAQAQTNTTDPEPQIEEFTIEDDLPF